MMILLAVGLISTSLLTAPPAQATKRGANGQIAWGFSFGSGNIVRKNSDGSGVETPLTPVGYYDPSWSPDGRRIAAEGPSGSIVMFPSNGGPIVTLDSPGDLSPSWSPNGRYIAFEKSSGVYIIPVDLSTGPIFVADGVGPDWSPDGSKLAFVDDATGTLYTIDVFPSAGTQVPRTRPKAVATVPGDSVVSWSPDGTKIAYQAPGSAAPIQYVRLGNLAPVTILNTNGLRHPEWAPDGRSIALDDPAGGIYTMRISDLTRTTVSKTGQDPAWEAACRYNCRRN
jgi:Tol biopolymer transport system component